MIFGEVAIAAAEGAILAHSIKLPGRALKKGRRLDAADLAALAAAGIERIVAARREPGDVGEDAAASRIAAAAAGTGVRIGEAFTGRVNLFAATPGVCAIDRARLDRLNLVDEAVTIATLEPYAVVEPKQMVATIKIIPFAAPGAIVERCAAIAAEGGPLVGVAPFRPTEVALVQTRLPGLKESILDKTVETTRHRLAALGSRLAVERRCPHDAAALADTLQGLVGGAHGLVLVAGASAIVDRRDVIPAAILAAGGAVEHFGMPVDPGNLLLLGRIEAIPVLGLPGCARSPKENGFDWVLRRLLAGVPVAPADIQRLGAGGLLAEIPSRPAPRAETPAPAKPSAPRAPAIGGVVLAAGQSRRMGALNKLLVEIGGTPMVRHSVAAVLASGVGPVIVVLGHDKDRVQAALAGLAVSFVENPDYADGLSTSLRRGIAALPDEVAGALVALGDMPFIAGPDIGRLLAAFNPTEGRAIVVPTRRGKRGNPVLWARRFFAEMQEAAGDAGAKHLIGAYPELVAEVEIASDGVLVDIDTPQALAAATRKNFAVQHTKARNKPPTRPVLQPVP